MTDLIRGMLEGQEKPDETFIAYILRETLQVSDNYRVVETETIPIGGTSDIDWVI